MELQTAQKVFKILAGGTFVGMDTETKVKLKGGKKNPQQGRVTKVMQGAQVMSFSNQNGSAYAAMVQRRLAAEGRDPASFEVGPRAWGERIAGTPFVEHKGKHYLEVIFLNAGQTQYLLDGHPVQEHEIQGLPEKPKPTGQANLENQVVIRTFALESITELRAYGLQWQ